MDIQQLKGVGPKTAASFHRLGVDTVEAVLLDLPVRYEDRQTIASLGALRDGERVVVMGRLEHLRRPIRLRGNRSLLRAEIADEHESVGVVWHNQPYRARSLSEGQMYYFYGTYVEKNQALNDPVVSPVSDAEFLGYFPVYRLTEGLTNAKRVAVVREALKQSVALDDPFPAAWRQHVGLMGLRSLIETLHFPRNEEALRKALDERAKRDALEHVLIRRLIVATREQKRALAMEKRDISDLIARLPFHLTVTQEQAFATIENRLLSSAPMNVLLQGDVGSGKTIVALLGAAVVLRNGYSAALMAPTEVLATQHAKTAEALLGEGRVCLLTGSTSRAERRKIAERAEEGGAFLFVGTHALFQDAVHFSHLGLVMTDEQHRFGVKERGKLQGKLVEPNTLVLSATPIPRTMTLVDWGDLELVRLTDRPPGRVPIITRAVDARSERAALDGILRQVREGHRAYVVCPLITPGETDLKRWSVEATAARIQRYVGQKAPETARVGVLTGPMSAEDKEAVFTAFGKGEINILVSTTVIEVGVDVPEATVMLVMAAERFGLAQLHQLRGRVGRGSDASFCVLLSASPSPAAKKRLRFLEETDDGWEIAREDLTLRGAGTRLGTAQHGMSVSAEETLARLEKQRWAEEALSGLVTEQTLSNLPPSLKAHLDAKVASYQNVTLN